MQTVESALSDEEEEEEEEDDGFGSERPSEAAERNRKLLLNAQGFHLRFSD